MRRLTLRERVLLVLLAVVAAVSGYVLLVHNPITAREEALQIQLEEDGALSDQLALRVAELARMEQALAQWESGAEGAAAMPDYDNLQGLMVELNRILSGCRAYTITFGGTETTERVVRRQVTLPFTCDTYQQARSVLEQLHQSGLRCLLQDVDLVWQDAGQVQVTATMVFFEYNATPS